MTDTGNGDTTGQGDPLDDIDFEEFQLDEPQQFDPAQEYVAYEPPPPALISCPSCGAAQAATNRHCEQCGARLSQNSLPVAPRPLRGMDAGTRALTIGLSVIAGVVILAVLWNLVLGGDSGEAAASGDDGASSDTAPTSTTTTLEPIGEIVPFSVSCSSVLSENLACENLIDGTDAPWQDAGLKGENALITFNFDQPVALDQVHFYNITDDTRFRRNYRVRGVEITADDVPGLPFPDQLDDDNSRHQVVSVGTLATQTLTVRITSVWPSEAIDGKAFDELAIEEIKFWGRQVSTAPASDDGSTSSDG